LCIELLLLCLELFLLSLKLFLLDPLMARTAPFFYGCEPALKARPRDDSVSLYRAIIMSTLDRVCCAQTLRCYCPNGRIAKGEGWGKGKTPGV
jgi:hypothetical protein